MALGSRHHCGLWIPRVPDGISSDCCHHGKSGHNLWANRVVVDKIKTQYAIDSYKPVSGQIMVTSTVVKNTFGVSSFSTLKWIPPKLINAPTSLE